MPACEAYTPGFQGDVFTLIFQHQLDHQRFAAATRAQQSTPAPKLDTLHWNLSFHIICAIRREFAKTGATFIHSITPPHVMPSVL
jgi:hypothetical protein